MVLTGDFLDFKYFLIRSTVNSEFSEDNDKYRGKVKLSAYLTIIVSI